MHISHMGWWIIGCCARFQAHAHGSAESLLTCLLLLVLLASVSVVAVNRYLQARCHVSTKERITATIRTDAETEGEPKQESNNVVDTTHAHGSAYSIAKQRFLSQNSAYYGYNGMLANLRALDFSRLTTSGTTYLDNAGSALYSERQIQNALEEMQRHILSNPHSAVDGLGQAAQHERELRASTLAMCGADPLEYEVIFTSGATAALKLVAEAFPWLPGSCFAYTRSNHTSVLGMREHALAAGAQACCVELPHPSAGSQELRCVGPPMARRGASVQAGGAGVWSLFAYPLECNFSGDRYSQHLVDEVQRGGVPCVASPPGGRWMVLLDAAKAMSSHPPDLSRHPADFVALSYYKIFGYPTGLGALLVRRRALRQLRGSFFGGGTVELAVPNEDHVARRSGHAGWEHGTGNFLAVSGARHGFAMLRTLGGLAAVRGHGAALSAWLAAELRALRHGNGRPLCQLYGWAAQEGDGPALHGPTVTFNVLRADGGWVGCQEVNRMADLHGIVLRVGCFCNPGACARFLGLSAEDSKRHHAAGHVCSDGRDIMEGRPIGAVRASLGYATSFEDVHALVQLLSRHFLETAAPCNGDTASGQRATGWPPSDAGLGSSHATHPDPSAPNPKSDPPTAVVPAEPIAPSTPDRSDSGDDSPEAPMSPPTSCQLPNSMPASRHLPGSAPASRQPPSTAPSTGLAGLPVQAGSGQEAEAPGQRRVSSGTVLRRRARQGRAGHAGDAAHGRDAAAAALTGAAAEAAQGWAAQRTQEPAAEAATGWAGDHIQELPASFTMATTEPSHKIIKASLTAATTAVAASTSTQPPHLCSLQAGPGSTSGGHALPWPSPSADTTRSGSAAVSAASAGPSPPPSMQQNFLHPIAVSSGATAWRSPPSGSLAASAAAAAARPSPPPSLRQIFVYPIKSCAAVSVSAWPLGPNGLLLDREWALVDPEGVAVTQKACPRMALVTPQLDLRRGEMLVTAPNMASPLIVDLELQGGAPGAGQGAGGASPRWMAAGGVRGVDGGGSPLITDLELQGGAPGVGQGARGVSPRRVMLGGVAGGVWEGDGGQCPGGSSGQSQEGGGGEMVRDDAGSQLHGVRVCGQEACATLVGESSSRARVVAAWFTEALGVPCRLVRQCSGARAAYAPPKPQQPLAGGGGRPRGGSTQSAPASAHGRQDPSIGFANDGQFLLVNAASLEELSRRMAAEADRRADADVAVQAAPAPSGTHHHHQHGRLADNVAAVHAAPAPSSTHHHHHGRRGDDGAAVQAPPAPCSTPHHHQHSQPVADFLRFRPNLVVDGFPPYAEDGWGRVCVGGQALDVAGPCARCEMVLVDPLKGQRGSALMLRTLASYRKVRGKINFGVFLTTCAGGDARLGSARGGGSGLMASGGVEWMEGVYGRVVRVGDAVQAE